MEQTQPEVAADRREERKAVHVVAKLFTLGKAETVVCGDLSTGGCQLRINHTLNPKAHINIALYIKKDGGENLEECAPITATVRWCRPSKSDPKVFFAGIQFNHEVNVNHGVLQVLYPERFQKVEMRKLETTNSSLMGTYVTCFICGQKEIPFYALRSKTMMTKSNIFGIPSYLKPMPGKDFCDYNLIQVCVCPTCLFGSSSLAFFSSPTASECPFNQREFNKIWTASVPSRKQKLDNELDGFFGEKRSLKQAIVAYGYAIDAFTELTKLGDPIENTRKVVSFLMFQAELLSHANDKKAGDANLQQVIKFLEPLFPQMDGETIIRSALLLALLKLYFKENQGFSQYMLFLKNYDKDSKLDPAGGEAKTLKMCLDQINKAYQDREQFAHDQLKSYHLS